MEVTHSMENVIYNELKMRGYNVDVGNLTIIEKDKNDKAVKKQLEVDFIDDYFNCLTVGSVMRPVTDKHNVSRAKLAYLIDATAAPVCIIAPISSWAAAVTGFVEGEDGFSIFIRAIPYNFYALLTIVMMLTIVLLKFDYGPIKLHESNA